MGSDPSRHLEWIWQVWQYKKAGLDHTTERYRSQYPKIPLKNLFPKLEGLKGSYDPFDRQWGTSTFHFVTPIDPASTEIPTPDSVMNTGDTRDSYAIHSRDAYTEISVATYNMENQHVIQLMRIAENLKVLRLAFTASSFEELEAPWEELWGDDLDSPYDILGYLFPETPCPVKKLVVRSPSPVEVLENVLDPWMFGGKLSLIEELEVGYCSVVEDPGDADEAYNDDREKEYEEEMDEVKRAQEEIVRLMEDGENFYNPPGPFRSLKEHPEFEKILDIVSRQCPRLRKFSWKPFIQTSGYYSAKVVLPPNVARMSIRERRAFISDAC